jgi:hypothetical protein
MEAQIHRWALPSDRIRLYTSHLLVLLLPHSHSPSRPTQVTLTLVWPSQAILPLAVDPPSTLSPIVVSPQNHPLLLHSLLPSHRKTLPPSSPPRSPADALHPCQMTSLPPTHPSCPTRETIRARTRAHPARQTPSATPHPQTPSTRARQLQPRQAAEAVSPGTRPHTPSGRPSSPLPVDPLAGLPLPTPTPSSCQPTPSSLPMVRPMAFPPPP